MRHGTVYQELRTPCALSNPLLRSCVKNCSGELTPDTTVMCSNNNSTKSFARHFLLGGPMTNHRGTRQRTLKEKNCFSQQLYNSTHFVHWSVYVAAPYAPCFKPVDCPRRATPRTGSPKSDTLTVTQPSRTALKRCLALVMSSRGPMNSHA